MKTKILRNIIFSLGAIFALAITVHAQNLYVGTAGDEAIYEYTPSGAQSFFFCVASPPMSHHVGGRPRGLAFDSNGNLFLAFFTEEQLLTGHTIVSKVLKFNPLNQVTTIGNVANFQFQGLAVDSAGNVFVAADDSLEKDFGPNGEVPPSIIFKFTPSGDRMCLAPFLAKALAWLSTARAISMQPQTTF